MIPTTYIQEEARNLHWRKNAIDESMGYKQKLKYHCLIPRPYMNYLLVWE